MARKARTDSVVEKAVERNMQPKRPHMRTDAKMPEDASYRQNETISELHMVIPAYALRKGDEIYESKGQYYKIEKDPVITRKGAHVIIDNKFVYDGYLARVQVRV